MKPRVFKDERVQRVWDAAYASAFVGEFYSQHEAARKLGERDHINNVLDDMGKRIAEVAIVIADKAVAELEKYE